jgi:RNA polymerase sigma factor (sigma-70 family)
MTAAPLDTVLRHIRRITPPPQEPTDGELLSRFVARRDEPAFAELVRRHGPMVLGVCRRALRNPPDRDDAFQATFLVLVRRAADLTASPCLGPWLYGVARRTALKARAVALCRRVRQTEVSDMAAPETADALADGELRQLLEEELDRLPEKYRAPLVLCYLQGRTHEQAARELGRPAGSMSRHVRRALDLLRGRLVRRGVVLSAVALSAALTDELSAGAVSPALAGGTVRAALLVAAGGAAAAPVAALAGSVSADMTRAPVKAVTALLLTVAVIAGTAGLVACHAPAAPPGGEPDMAKPAAEAPRKADADGDPLPAGALRRFGSTRLRHGQAIGALAFSKDGKSLLSGSVDQTVSLWELPSGKEIRRFTGHEDYVTCVALSPDGKVVAAGAKDFRLWDAATGKELHHSLPSCLGEIWGADFSPDGKWVAYGTVGPAFTALVEVIEVATGKRVVALNTAVQAARDNPHNCAGQIAFAPDGKTLASAGYDNVVRLWDVATAKETAQLSGHTAPVLAVAFAPDGKTLASGSHDGTARLWDVRTGKETKKLDADSGINIGVSGVSFSPDGKQLAACTTASRVVRVYDVASGKETHALAGGRFRRVAFSPDGKTLAAGDGNNAVRLWEMPSGKVIQPAEPHDSGVHCIALSPDGKTLAASTTFKTVYLWDMKTGKMLRRLEGHEQGVYPVTFSPDGKRVASGSRDGTARVWDVATGKELHKFSGYDAPRDDEEWVYGLSFSPDGKRLAGACRDGAVRVWDLGSGREVLRCGRHDGFAWGVAFSPDGKQLVSCGDDAVLLWNAATGEQVRQMAPGARNEAVAFSPDGRLIAAGSKNGFVRLIDAESGQTLHMLKEHPNGDYRRRLVYRDGRTIAFSPDGRTLAWGSWQVVQVWEVATGQEVLSFPAHRGEVMSVAFLPDGRRLATGSPDTTALVWDLSACALGGPAKVKPAEVDGLWADLHGGDARKGYRALWALASAPKEVMPLLRAQLKPVPAPDHDRLGRLVKDLDADEFEVRERATEELGKLGGAAEGVLRKALKSKPSAEVKQRVELLLGKLRATSASPDHAREARAMELLVQVEAAEATDLLKELAKGAPGAWLTEEARAALKRFEGR